MADREPLRAKLRHIPTTLESEAEIPCLPRSRGPHHSQRSESHAGLHHAGTQRLALTNFPFRDDLVERG